jgi:PQQ-like domain
MIWGTDARRRKIGLGLVGTVAAALLVGVGQALSGAPAAPEISVWTYHGDLARDGDFVVPELTWDRAKGLHRDPQFQASVSGAVYAQPLFWRGPGAENGMLVVATAEDVVYGLDADTGAELWKRQLGSPVVRALLPCGNIPTQGVTGTPVINASRGEVYLDAYVNAGGPKHLVFGLDLTDGTVLPGWPVDIAAALAATGQSFDPVVQNQRGALALVDGVLFVPFGGHGGDCGDYHGWVVGVPLDRGQAPLGWQTRAGGGGIWAQGGVSSDGRELFVATGNTRNASDWSDGEAVIRLTAALLGPTEPRDFFTPENWQDLDRLDLDLGGTNPVIFDLPGPAGPASRILALGKDGRAYLLDRNNLGGIAGSLATVQVSPGEILSAPVAYPSQDGIFVAFEEPGEGCPSGVAGLTVLKVTGGPKPTIVTAWCAALSGTGSPIVTTTDGIAQPVVWALGAEGDGRLHGFRGDTGEPIFAGGGPAEAMAGLHHLQTLLAADGRLYVGADGQIYAFTY